MRISDWSSDVCSSDLIAAGESILEAPRRFAVAIIREIKQVSLGRYRYEAICEHHCCPQVAIFVKRDAIDQTVTQGRGPVHFAIGKGAILLHQKARHALGGGLRDVKPMLFSVQQDFVREMEHVRHYARTAD